MAVDTNWGGKMVRGFGLALLISAMTLGASDARATALYQTLYSFTGTNDGDNPNSGLVLDPQGNLYGTTPLGGTFGHGTVFKLAPDGTFTTIHQFAGGRDGAEPSGAALTIDAHGTLYGTTISGGVANGGTAWRVRHGRLRMLHSFGVGSDGYWPYAGLLLGDDGSLTGTTLAGGIGCSAPMGCGIVFRLAADGSETVLHDFAGGTDDGAGPVGTLARDGVGNFFGVTYQGGLSNYGTIFKLAADGSESVFYKFPYYASSPFQGLLVDRRGNLYGTTDRWYQASRGALFKIDSEGQLKTVQPFAVGPTGLPSLIRDRSGNLYGTQSGSVFKFARDNTQTIVHAFDGPGGRGPAGGVISDSNGNLYGTTYRGGVSNRGTIFKLSLESK